jgi:hypothetical protein
VPIDVEQVKPYYLSLIEKVRSIFVGCGTFCLIFSHSFSELENLICFSISHKSSDGEANWNFVASGLRKEEGYLVSYI